MRIEAIPFLAVVFDWCCCFWLVLLFLAGAVVFGWYSEDIGCAGIIK
jgi:hypothetical protein